MTDMKLAILMYLVPLVSSCSYSFSWKVMRDNYDRYLQEVNEHEYKTKGRHALASKLPFGNIILAFCDNATEVRECDLLMLGMMSKDLYAIYENESLKALEQTLQKFDAKLGMWFKERVAKFKEDDELTLEKVLSPNCVAEVKKTNKVFPVTSNLASQLLVPMNVTRGYITNFMLRVLAVAVENKYEESDKQILCEEAVKNNLFERLYIQYQGLWMGQSYQTWLHLQEYFKLSIEKERYDCFAPLITKTVLSRSDVTEREEETFKDCYGKRPQLIDAELVNAVLDIRFGGVTVVGKQTFTQLWGQTCVNKLQRLYNYINFNKQTKYIPPAKKNNRMENFLNLLFNATYGYLLAEDSYEAKTLMCDYGIFQFISVAQGSLFQYMTNSQSAKYNLSLEAALFNPYSSLIESLCYDNQGYYCFIELSSDINPKVLNGSEVSNEQFKKFKDHYEKYIRGKLSEFTGYLKKKETWLLRDFIPGKCMDMLREKFLYFDFNVDLKSRIINRGFGNLGFMSLTLIFGIMRHYFYNNKVSKVIEMNNKFCDEILKTEVFFLLKVSFTFNDERSTTAALTPMFKFLSRSVCFKQTSQCKQCLDKYFTTGKISNREISFDNYKAWKLCSNGGKDKFQNFRKLLSKATDISIYIPKICFDVLQKSGFSYKIFGRFDKWDNSADTLYLQKLWKYSIIVALYFFQENSQYPLTKYVCETVVTYLVKVSNFAFPELSKEVSKYNETNGLAIILKTLCAADSYCEAYYKKMSVFDSPKMKGLSILEYLSFLDCKDDTETAVSLLDDFIQQRGGTWTNCFVDEGSLIFEGYPQFNLDLKPPGRGLISDFSHSVDYYVMSYEAMCYYFSNTSITKEDKALTADLLHNSMFTPRFLRVIPNMDTTFAGSDVA